MIKRRFSLNIYQLIIVLFIVSIWAFNEEKYITYPLKIIYIAVLLFYCFKKNRLNTVFQFWTLLMIALSLFACLIARFEPNSLYTLVNMLQVFIIGFVTFGYLDHLKKINFFIVAILIGGLVLTARLLITTPLSVFLSFERLGESIGYNANDVGNKAMISALACIFIMRRLKSKKRAFLLLSFLPLFAVVLFSGSRKDLLGLFLGLFVVYTIGLKNKKNLFVSLIVIFALLIFVYYLIMNNDSLYMTIGRRIESLINSFSGGSEAGSIDIRKVYMTTAWGFVVDSYFVGIGLGQFAVLSGYGVYCHCDYLEVMCSYGLLGFVAYYAPYIIYFLKLMVKKPKTAVDYSMISLEVVLLFMCVTMVMYISAYSIILLCLIASSSTISEKSIKFCPSGNELLSISI